MDLLLHLTAKQTKQIYEKTNMGIEFKVIKYLITLFVCFSNEKIRT